MQNELYHHGILGQRWGVRRFQNKDGSRTPEGKRRYSKTVSDADKQNYLKKNNLNREYNKAVINNSKTKLIKDTVDQSANLIRQFKQYSDERIKNEGKNKKLDLSKMTDQELRSKINRELLERQYNNLFAEESSTVTKGQKTVNDVLSFAGSTMAVTSSALGIALAIRQMKGK